MLTLFFTQLHLKILLMLIFVSGLGGTLQHGLNMSLVNAPSAYIKCFINETWRERYETVIGENKVKMIWSVIVSIYSIGGLIGALIAGHLSVKYGRKNSLIFSNFLTLVAAVFVGFSRMAKSFEMILMARFLYGIQGGIGLHVHSIYIMECSPKKLRGVVTLSIAISISIGKCTGQIMGLKEILGSESTWPLLLAFNAIPAFMQLVILPWFPESPRYLMIDKGNRTSSINALQRLWGKRDFSQEVEDMQAERDAINNGKARSVFELCKDRSVRCQLIINLMISLFLQLSGINAACLIERAGRKVLLWGGFAFMTIWTGLLTISLSLQSFLHWVPYCSLFIIFAYIFSYAIGPGGVTIILPTEIFLQSDRPAGFVINGILNWFGLFIIGMFFSFIVENLGYLCFLIFCGICLLLTVFSYFVVLETMGKTPLEIAEEFKRRNLWEKVPFGLSANRTLPQNSVEIIMSTAF
eukprot:gi/632983323/ref/XP_007908590.1/ PREDICTED: solute carrier family 2, facilitated glucose transporter member 11-like isoform X3 [Callorhinchus milii]